MPIAISRNENDSEFYGLPLFEANEEFYEALTDGLENYSGAKLSGWLKDIKMFSYGTPSGCQEEKDQQWDVEEKDLDSLVRIATEKMRLGEKPFLVKLDWKEIENTLREAGSSYPSLEEEMARIRRHVSNE